MSHRSRMIAAMLAGMLTLPDEVRRQGKILVVDDAVDDPPAPEPERREYPYHTERTAPAFKMLYPPEGGGSGHPARLERQHAKGMLDFAASEKCLERIKARLERDK